MKKILFFLALAISFSAFSQTETKLHPAQLLQAGATNGQALIFNTGSGEWQATSISTGTDDQTISLTGNTLSIESGNSVDLSGYLDNTDAQDLSLSGNTLSLTGDGTTVNLAPYLDNTDDQVIDVFTLASNTLSLSLENDGEATKTISLAAYLDNTDDQKIDVFSITSDNINLSLEADGEATKTVSLAPYKQTLSYTNTTGALSLTNGGSVNILVSAQYTQQIFTNLTTGNTVTVTGTLPADRDGVVVTRGGLVQREGATADFTVSGSVITFVARNFENGETVVVKYPN